MIRLPFILTAMAILAVPSLAQDDATVDECNPSTLFQALGIEAVEGCETGNNFDGVVDSQEGDVNINPVAISAELPGNNSASALAHSNSMSNGTVETAHARNENRAASGNAGDGNRKSAGRP